MWEAMQMCATADESAEIEAREADIETKQAEAEARATQKAALLNRIGITEEEAKLLLA
jgi:hypothetical protein